MPVRPSPITEGLFSALQSVGSAMFRPCGIPQCTHRSLGMICKRCSRFVCQRHVYAKPSIPPEIVCASCIIDAHVELLEDDGGDQRRSRSDDPNVIDAELG